MKNLIADRKAKAAVRLLRTYCEERCCTLCIFHEKNSRTCLLNVKAPYCFPTVYERNNPDDSKRNNQSNDIC